MTAYVRPWVELLRGWLRGRGGLVLENAALRQQLAMYERRRPGVRDSDRLFWLLLVRFWPGWRGVLVAVRPETAVRWHQAGWRRYWTWKSRPRRRGCPRIDPEARELIMRLARENPRWGAVRIQGELRALGHDVSAETVRRYRLRALRRPPSESWRAFLGRSQAVIATAAASASDGFIQPRVCRGRPLSSRATASRRAWSWTARSVPLGKY